MSQKYAFVMMIHDKWWQEFLRKNRQRLHVHSYVKTGAASPKETSLILFYVTKPVGELAGHAEFVERKVGEADELWKQHGRESALKSKQQYEDFVKDRRKVSFIRFKNLQEAANPIPLKKVLMLLGGKRLSRQGFYVDKKTADKLLAIME
jgi:predicted transcriptional regulator